MNVHRHLLTAAFLLGLSGCASTTLQKQTFKSYSVGVVRTASIGETFLVDQAGSVEPVKSWV